MVNKTPAMQQYAEIKEKYKDCILLFQLGDFYEMFYEDAVIASEVLEITLTKRALRDTKIPLAGIPIRSAEPYIAKFVKNNYKLAICNQMEDPKLTKGVVKRAVVRVISPGTVMESTALESTSNNYILSIYCKGEEYGLALVDISTGEFLTSTTQNLFDFISIYNPSEIIIPESLCVNTQLKNKLKEITFLETYPDSAFNLEKSTALLKKQLSVQTLQGYGLTQPLAISAAGGLLQYLKETQKTALSYINKVKAISQTDYLMLDDTTIKNLELIKNIRGEKKETLLWVIDKTKTPMGSRLIKKWLLHPLLNLSKINLRLEAVEILINQTIIRKDLQSLLVKINDVERLISRINFGNCNARDLVALKNSAKIIPLIKRKIAQSKSSLLKNLSDMQDLQELFSLIDNSIKDEPSATLNDGNLIKKGYNQELDEIIKIRSSGKTYLKELERQEREKTGIKNLKVKYNKIFGYFIEITKSNLQLVPENYIRKQTLVNCERFITQELKEKEEQILNAEEIIIKKERELFLQIVKDVAQHTEKVQDTAMKIGVLDSLCSLAHVATNNNYYRPQINESLQLAIEAGRHPVLELTCNFVPNECNLTVSEMMIITGPNMAGKSTYMRQIALIAILAQIGSFVPASKAKIGLVDRIFTRVGAFDDLTHGQSTFMVEMKETANIVNNATSKSLIILDEIGRGTSTFDGVSLAWSVAEYIYKNIKAKTLFATHYHILNKLADSFENINNYNIAVKEKEGDVIFLRKIIKGGTDKSYGIHVAKLAGMPKQVLKRANEIQARLEQEDKMIKKIKADKDIKQTFLTDL